MPLFKKKLFTVSQPPAGVTADDEVFHIKATGEVVLEYETFLKRTRIYRARVWTCQFTGETDLTYEEAVAAEKRSEALLLQVGSVVNKPLFKYSLHPGKHAETATFSMPWTYTSI